VRGPPFGSMGGVGVGLAQGFNHVRRSAIP
jgi:hypothetical protein